MPGIGVAGGWIDHLNETHQPLVDYSPASSLYHLFLAAAEMEDGFGLRGNAGYQTNFMTV